MERVKEANEKRMKQKEKETRTAGDGGKWRGRMRRTRKDQKRGRTGKGGKRQDVEESGGDEPKEVVDFRMEKESQETKKALGKA